MLVPQLKLNKQEIMEDYITIILTTLTVFVLRNKNNNKTMNLFHKSAVECLEVTGEVSS